MRPVSIIVIALFSFLLSVSCTKVEERCSAGEEIFVIPAFEQTKANLISSDLTQNRVHVDGYFHGSAQKHIDANLLYEGNRWLFYSDIKDVHYYWPQKSSLDLFAYSPAKLDKTCVSLISTKSFSFTMPLTDSSQKNLDEFICGYTSGSKSTDDGGSITVPMFRPFSVVNFFLDEAVRSTIKTVSIKGLKCSGTYDASTKVWTLGSSGNFVCTIDKRFPIDINASSQLSGPVIVIPQTLEESVIMEFTYLLEGNSDVTVTETPIGKSYTEEQTPSMVSQWTAGNVYNYWISFNGAANEVRMSVTVEPWSVQGNSQTDVK